MREHIPEFSYSRKDFALDWFSGTGKGGQHRNKHQNCLRLTHIPSGITTLGADGRDRPTNTRLAFIRLKPKLAAWISEQLGSIEYQRSDEVIRTYHNADNRVVDHASGLTIAWSELDKRFGDLVFARAHFAQTAPKQQSGRA